MPHLVKINDDTYEDLKTFSDKKFKRRNCVSILLEDVIREYLKKHSNENI
jgi:hypothetical protein